MRRSASISDNSHMARGHAVAGSLVAHGAIAVIVAALVAHGGDERTSGSVPPVAIELVSSARALSPPAPGATADAPAGASTPAELPPRPAPAAPRHAPVRPAAALRAAPRLEPSTGPTGDAAVAASGDEPRDGVDGDPRAGGGAGRGNGIGFGAGGRIDSTGVAAALRVPTPEPAPAPPPSRARPPRLIYPARDREIDESLLFVARLTIDPDGFVVGARLLRGPGGRSDERAASAVWRFRYSPALDDGGRPITATIEQRFAVE